MDQTETSSTKTTSQAREQLKASLRKLPAKAKSTFNLTPAKIGAKKALEHSIKEKIVTNFYNRKRLLTVPPEIVAAHPDKEFVFLNGNKLAKNGYWHPEGYEVFKVDQDTQEQSKDKFNKSADGFVHRNEMVLAWMPKDLFEQRAMEREVIRGQRDVMEVLTKNPDLVDCSALASEEKEYILMKQQENING